jgi:ABC-2 type transport system ATP-binding protein
MNTCGRTGQVALRTEELTKHYGAIVGLESLSMTVTAGEVLGYLGPNGAGKTTTIRLLLGLIRPTAGRAEIFGMDVTEEKVAVHARVAYVPGEATLWPSLTGAETLHLLARMHGQTDVGYRDLLVKRFGFDTSRKVRAYSKGNRQKISLIAALATRADLLILDEPTAGLDPLMQQAFRESVLEAKGNGQTVFLSSHVLSEAEALCDRIAIVDHGKVLAEGTVEELKEGTRTDTVITVRYEESVTPALVERAGLSRRPSVTKVETDGDQVRVFTREPDGVLGELVAAGAAEGLHVRDAAQLKPSLETVFLTLTGREYRE